MGDNQERNFGEWPPSEVLEKLENYLPSRSSSDGRALNRSTGPEINHLFVYENDKVNSSACDDTNQMLPFVTLTYAMSLDGAISQAPNLQTEISGRESKALTHYMRTRHDGILVGANTAIHDNPGLNCKLPDNWDREDTPARVIPRKQHPVPIILDPNARWSAPQSCKLISLASRKTGKPPIVVITDSTASEIQRSLERESINSHSRYNQLCSSLRAVEGFFLVLPSITWLRVFKALYQRCGLKSIMVEGGARVISTLLSSSLYGEYEGRDDQAQCSRETLQNIRQMKPINIVNSVIITISPQWLGGGNVVRPDIMGIQTNCQNKHREHANSSPVRSTSQEGIPSPVPFGRLNRVQWFQTGHDVILCGTL